MNNEECTIVENGEKCINSYLAKDMCLKHYMRYYRHKRVSRVNIINRGNSCLKCKKGAEIKGLCRFHYNRRKRE